MHLLLSMVVCAAILILTTALPYDVIRTLSRYATVGKSMSRDKAPIILRVLVSAHILEIILYA
jgi:hypothetical protein